MKVLFDLRENADDGIYRDLQDLYEEPLKIIRLGDQPISACVGCWNCWLKTPGRCVMMDPMAKIYSDYINSDTVILLMDTAQGFINHQAKAFLDRTIPHYNPYIEIVDGECHHLARYNKYPDLVFFYNQSGLTNKEKQVIEDYLYRSAYHFQSKAFLIDNKLQLHQLQPRKLVRTGTDVTLSKPMEQLIIYNGSPRRSGSNSALILSKVKEKLGDLVEIRDLKQRDQWELWADTFKDTRNVMFFMPLYVHAMPSHVMGFLERLKPSQGSISFFVQSGFPESKQSHYLVAYFEQLALRLGRTYLGTAIKGGVEGLMVRPVPSQEKMMEPMVKAIAELVETGAFDPKSLQELAVPIQLGKGTLILFKLLALTGLTNFYWNKQLKDNHAYDKRFDRPYLIADK